MLVLDEHRSAVVRSLCELIVPGSARVGPEAYIDALLARMPEFGEADLELRADCDVRRVTIENRGDGPEATGVESIAPDGRLRKVEANVVVIAAGALATPGLLIRSGVREAGGGSPSGELIGRNLRFHPARLVEGLFDEVQDAHMVYPISWHCMQFQRDEAGGFVVAAATVPDPIGFARRLGRRLIRAASGRAGMRRGSRTRGYAAGALSLEGL